MGSNLTDLDVPLCGFGIPINVATTEPGDIGTDYTVADMQPGPFVPSSTSTVRFEATGTPVAAKDLHVQVVRPGVPGPAGMGIRYAETAVGGTPSEWYGADPIGWRTGYQEVVGSTMTNPRVVKIKNASGLDKLIAIYNASGSLRCVTRDVDGTWGSSVAIATVSSTAHDIMQASDGSIIVYGFRPTAKAASTAGTLHVYRSTDEGATWQLQTQDALSTTYTLSAANRVCAERLGAQVVLFTRTGTGASSTTRQWISRDGGFSFDEVGTARADFTVHDVVAANGAFHVATTEDVSSTDTYFTRRLGSAAIDISNTPSYDHGAGDHADRCALTSTETGLLVWVSVDQSGGGSISGKTSRDNGISWDSDGPNYTQDSSMTAYARDIGMAWLDGQVVAVTETPSAGFELRFGGHSTLPLGVDLDVVAASTAQGWVAIDVMTNGGWTDNSTGGTPTYTLDTETGLNIATAFGVVGILNQSSISTRGFFRYTARTNSGTLTTTIGNSTGQITIDLTSTQIRAYDSAASAPSYDTHSVSDHVEVLVVFDDNQSKARVYWREWDRSHNRAWTLASSAITVSAGSYTAAFDFRVSTSSSVDILEADFAEPLFDLALVDGASDAEDFSPVYASSVPVYLSNGVWVRSSGGLATVDGLTHTSTPTSPYRAGNMNPKHAPSPRRVWRSADVVSDESIIFPVADGPAVHVVAVYLDNMIGIRQLDIDLGPSMTSNVADLRQTIRYDDMSKQAIVISANGAGSGADRWVRADELRGWRFEDSSGRIWEVTGNTEGSIYGNASPDEHQARIFLSRDGTVLTTATAQTGYLYPNRALLLLYLGGTNAITKFQIDIVAADQYDPGTGYRQIGLAACCPVHLIGISPDMNDSIDIDNRSNIQETVDGFVYSAKRAPTRKTQTIAWVEAGHDVYQQHQTNGTRDYFTVFNNSGSPAGTPAGGVTGVPYVIEGIHRRADGEPLLWLPIIPYRVSAGVTTWSVNVFGHDAVWGRLPDVYRREGVTNIGPRGYQTWRIPSLQIVEET